MRAMAFVVVLSMIVLSTATMAGEDAARAIRSKTVRSAEAEGTLSKGIRTDVPSLMNYQGTLTDDAGIALNTTVSMIFTIYDADVGGSVLWTETQPSVGVDDGIFNVLLGSVNALSDDVFSDPVRWLGVQVDGDPELTPRQRIAAVGYAFWADEADTAEYVRSGGGGGWVDDGVVVRLETGSDDVGIGTSSPVSKLDVVGDINSSSVYRIGAATMLSNAGTDNTLVGVGAGMNNAGGAATFMGHDAGYNNQGSWNTFMGTEAGRANTTGDHNTFLGRRAGFYSTAGVRNIFIGSNSGRDNTEGSQNVAVGYGAGYTNTTGSGNVFLGYYAGYPETGSNKLYIDNTQTASPLVYGQFDNNILAINGSLGVGTTSPGQPLDVVGDVKVGGGSGDYDGEQEHISLRGQSDDWYVGVQNEAEPESTDFFIGKAAEDGMFHIENGGDVGIGTSEPAHRLDVRGDRIQLKEDGSGDWIALRTDGGALDFQWDGGNLYVQSVTDGEHILLNPNNANSRVAVGKTGPTEKLDVAGTAQMTGFKMPTSAADGYVLTSDASGVGTWQPAVGSADGDWTISGNDIYSAVSGNVGIGTTSPDQKLHVEGYVKCQVVEITGGSDLAEPFDIQEQQNLKAGLVMTIDAHHPGKLMISEEAYDRKVAGIISGAGNIKPGMLMGQSGTETTGEYPVALTGRVYCWADATEDSIQPGDLLTTSDTAGHAMKATDYARAQGAIIGKAMSSLEDGQGLVLVLVTLQ